MQLLETHSVSFVVKECFFFVGNIYYPFCNIPSMEVEECFMKMFHLVIDVLSRILTVSCLQKSFLIHQLKFYFSDQAEARRNKVKAARTRRDERQAQKRAEILQAYAKEDSAATTS